MKKKFLAGDLLRFRFTIYAALLVVIVSCEPENGRLGIDLFPPSDTILVYTDTIYDIEAKLVKSNPVFTSVNFGTPNSDRIFLLGALNDTITGLSRADIATQVTYTTLGNFGADPTKLDSLKMLLYCKDVVGDTSQDMRIMIYELTESLSAYQVYYSDYDITGKYDPVPLVDEVISPAENTFYEFDIPNVDLRDRIWQAIRDSVFESVDSVKKEFYGFYITSEVDDNSNLMAKIGLANPISRFGFTYVHDSVAIDTVEIEDYSWYHMNFNEFYTQKVNMFHHDFSGTALEQKLDNPTAVTPVLYAQGMAGVNVQLSVPGFDKYLDSTGISINSARLVFEVLPDSLSGIDVNDYPQSIMLSSIVSDTTKEVIYDYLTNSGSRNFGSLIRSNSVSAFLNPLYLYKFNLGLHLQSVLTGAIENRDLVLYMNDPASSTEIIKLWSNESEQKESLRLELVYTKF